MRHTLFHLYGPFAVHSYGLMIALGLLIFIYLMQRDSRFAKLNLEPYFTQILMVGIVAALFGGRILFAISHPELVTSLYDFFAFWQGGFSILGAIIACLFILPFYCASLGVSFIGVLDLAAIYAPLLQSVSRIGCFLAGCCYGAPTTISWGVTYTDIESAAPLYVCVHPTQLYSSIQLMLIFTLMYFVLRKLLKKPGQLVCAFVILTSTERFITDFWRGDQIETSLFASSFSFYQIIALSMITAAFGAGIFFSTRKKNS